MGYFVLTSNVDGHFLRSGFNWKQVLEAHGSSFRMQRLDVDLGREVWTVHDDFSVEVDEDTFCAKDPLPVGPPGAGLLPMYYD